MARKEELINKLIDKPEEFTDSEFDELITDKQFTNSDLRPILSRLFDKNDDIIRNDSTADKGLIGKLNKKSFIKREKRFWKKINKGHVSTLILAEGDSWLEYPIYLKDIVDQLNKREDYAIKSLASGGDWISNMLYEQQYIEELSIIKPDVFIISGGGNDIVGNYRLAQLLHNRKHINKPTNIDLNSRAGKLQFAQLCLNKEFQTLIKLFKLQYKLLFTSIYKKSSKFKDMKIILQGYDYAIPSINRGYGFNILNIGKPILNMITNNGKWLYSPLMLLGYKQQDEKNAIVYGMIDAFNEMLSELVGKEHQNIYFIDSRGAVDEKKGWFDELHPKSHEFKKIASVFAKCIDSKNTSKHIYKVADE